MPYNEAHILEIAHLKTYAEAVRMELDDLGEADQSLGTLIQTLSARYDANVKASTDGDADYAAEVVDARVDTWGTEHDSLGANIRVCQRHVLENENSLQQQLQLLSEAVIRQSVMLSEIREALREAKEEE